jgi:hypothetical protein
MDKIRLALETVFNFNAPENWEEGSLELAYSLLCKGCPKTKMQQIVEITR